MTMTPAFREENTIRTEFLESLIALAIARQIPEAEEMLRALAEGICAPIREAEIARLVERHIEAHRAQQQAQLAHDIEADKGVCQICQGDARVCYPRHAAGRSCA